MTPQRRVLVPITYGFSVRYLLPTGVLDGLREVGTPAVGLGWDDAELEALLRARGFETVRLPDARLEHRYRMFRRRVAIVHQRRLASVTSEIQREQRTSRTTDPRARAIQAARRMVDLVAVSRPGGAAAVERREPAEVRAGTNVADFGRFLADHRVDALLSVTPYHDQDGLLLWAARERGVPSLTSVISFDNPTTRERMIARSERIVVWNRYNADELVRAYPDLDEQRVGVIGAPQFDLHRRPELVLEEDEWRKRLDLPQDRPVILYGAGPSSLIPRESGLVEVIDRAIDDGRIPGRPFLLVRRHPNDPPEPWHALQSRLRQSRVVDPWAPGSTAFRGWPTDEDLELQMSSLAHSVVHVNVCSSMTLDGAMFDRPQVGPTFAPGANPDEAARIRAYYRQEHWLPIARSGGLANADDEAELVAAIADGLEHPDRLSPGRRRMVSEVLTWDDGGSSARLVAEVARLL